MINLKFGTAGLRGVMGKEIDIDVIKRATQGLAQFLLANTVGRNPVAVVSYDSRNNSRLYAVTTASVLAANGIDAYLWPEMMPVPVLSFSIRELKADCGVMITASHNRKEYNGYKVYNSTGGQILDEEAARIEQAINTATAIKEGGDYTFVDWTVYDRYLHLMNDACHSIDGNLGIVYTPLNGSGLKPVIDMFEISDMDYSIVEEQEAPDGDFPTCPYPNPEKEEVYELAKKYAGSETDILIATDPDCDRVGCMVREHEGGAFRLLSGNEIGTIIAYFLCETGQTGTIVSSIVSTPMINRFARDYDIEVLRTHVGFKYIGDQMDKLKAQGKKFLLGFEESNGYLMGDYARDKDGVLGVKAIVSAASYFKSQGKTLCEILDEIYEKYGMIINKTISIDVASVTEKDELMSRVRGAGIATVDYISGVNGLPQADVLEMDYEDGSRMIVRPSGTEPKIKLYLSAESEERIRELEEEFKRYEG